MALYKTNDLFKFIWIFYDRKKKRWPFNTDDCLIEVMAWASLTLLYFVFREREKIRVFNTLHNSTYWSSFNRNSCSSEYDLSIKSSAHNKCIYLSTHNKSVLYPAISTFAVQICYTNKLFNLRINFPGTL